MTITGTGTTGGVGVGGGCVLSREPNPEDGPDGAVPAGGGGACCAIFLVAMHLRQACGSAWQTGHRMGMEQLLQTHMWLLSEEHYPSKYSC